MRCEGPSLRWAEPLEGRDETRLADLGSPAEDGPSGSGERDRRPSCVVGARAPAHQPTRRQPAHHHRDGALMRVRPGRELVDRGRIAGGELMQDEELRAADPQTPLGGPCGDAKRPDDAPQRIHDCTNVDRVVSGALELRPPTHLHSPMRCYIGANTLENDATSTAGSTMSRTINAG